MLWMVGKEPRRQAGFIGIGIVQMSREKKGVSTKNLAQSTKPLGRPEEIRSNAGSRVDRKIRRAILKLRISLASH